MIGIWRPATRNRLLAFFLVLLGWAAHAGAQPKSILVIGPHPDDETMFGGGRTRAAVLAGNTVHVVLTTNGDIDGTAAGLQREGESVAAAAILGVPEQNVVFLGYGDQIVWPLYSSTSPTTVLKSQAGVTATYATRGMGGVDFHKFLTGQSGAYSRQTILGDFKSLITYFQPDEIYTTGFWDNHGDHDGTAHFLNEAIIALRKEGWDIRTKVFHSMVWPPDTGNNCYGPWPPAGGSAPLPYPPYPQPPCVQAGTSLDWNRTQHFPVPDEMQLPDPASNLKWQALAAYLSQFNDFLASYVRKDEFFWRYDAGINMSATATVTASSDYPEALGPKEHINDGLTDTETEWKSLDDSGAWIQLDWTSPVRIAQIDLSDRLDPNDNVTAATLLFSDGSSVSTGALIKDGKPTSVKFAPRTVTWVRFRMDQYTGSTPGLAEMTVLGVPAWRTDNVAPLINLGPLASPSVVSQTQTSTLAVDATDLDGDPLQYTWSADAGTITGAGSSAVFTPPSVAADTIVTITVVVSDGRGGVTSNSTFVTVSTAGVQGLSISPTTVAAGLSSTGTVLIGSNAPNGGIIATLSSSDPAVASVPSSVLIPAGANKASFPISTGSVAAPTSVTISASFGSVVKQATLTVTRPVIASLALSPSTVVGGNNTTATAALTAVAPADGVTLNVATDSPGIISVPATVTVQPGAKTATFTVGSGAVTASQSFNVSASDGVATAAASGTVTPLLLSSLTLTPTAVTGGGTSVATVTLNGSAPAGGVSVSMTSSDPAASLLQTLVVPEGASTATATVTTASVQAQTLVTITAVLGTVTKTASLTIKTAVLSTLALSPTSVVGGLSSTGTVTLGSAAPAGGVSVALTSDNAAATVPASVVVPAGATTGTFTINTSFVTTAASAKISAKLGTVTKSATLSIKVVALSSLALAPTTVKSTAMSVGTVKLTGPAGPGGLTVTLTSANTAAATVPPAVVVPQGATSATFNIATSVVTAKTSVVISATYGGVTKNATLTINLVQVSSIKLAPISVTGGGTSTATVTLNTAAPPAGVTVALASSNTTAATVPATLLIPGGATSGTFVVTTSPVASQTVAAISATFVTTKSANLTVK